MLRFQCKHRVLPSTHAGVTVHAMLCPPSSSSVMLGDALPLSSTVDVFSSQAQSHSLFFSSPSFTCQPPGLCSCVAGDWVQDRSAGQQTRSSTDLQGWRVPVALLVLLSRRKNQSRGQPAENQQNQRVCERRSWVGSLGGGRNMESRAGRGTWL